MCGIAGVILKGGAAARGARESLAPALQCLNHRGPDGEGWVETDGALLAHRRLAIVDLPGGCQPLSARDGRLHAVCNGEIYNHEAIRRSFRSAYRFRTRSDSEVLLPLFEHARTNTVCCLDGMYAFLLAGRNRFYAARDPIGIKPLYYGRGGQGLLFASEAKALAGHVEEIEEFPPGHYYTPESGFTRYYDVPDPAPRYCEETTACRSLRQVLEKSVRKRLMADVPVGVFLSGGLDSSVVAALARLATAELHTFAVGLPDSPDLGAARTVAEHIGSIHHEVLLREDQIRAALPRIVYHLESSDRALVRSAVPNWFVARLAAQTRFDDGRYCKVILTGEGADELFAGYHYLRAYTDPAELQRELRRLVGALHGLNLQRLDRMTMAHGIEGRVPFLDAEFIETALAVDPTLKVFDRHGREKALLRDAFADLLPPEIVQREKLEFASGATRPGFLGKLLSPQGESAESVERDFYERLLARQFNTPFAPSARHRWQGPVL